MTALLEILTALSAISLAWWLLRKMLRPKAPAEPADEPFSFVPASRKKGPKGKSGAVALEEPEDEHQTDAFPPRVL